MYTGFPQIDIAAIPRRLDAPLALWYSARLLDRRGSGSVDARRVWPTLPTATLWRIVQRGAGLFWNGAPARLFLRRPPAVATGLGIPRLRTVYERPARWLGDRRRRAWIFLNAVSLLRKGRPIAVSTMARMAGVSRRTILRWLRLTGWGRVTNAVLLERLHGATASRHVNKRSRDGRVLRVELNGEIWLAARLPNSLSTGRPPVKKRGLLRRANARLQSCDLGDHGERQLYFMPSQHPPALPTDYQFHSKGKDPPIQVWLPKGSPLKDG